MESNFEKLNNENIDGDFYRCINCKEVMEKVEGHACPLPPRVAEMKEIIAMIGDENLSAEERIRAVWMLQEETKKDADLAIKKIESEVNPGVLYKLVYAVILENIKNVRHYRDQEYIKNDERRLVGMGFEERMKLIDKKKVEWCDVKEKELIHDSKHFKVKPIREWLNVADIEWAKSRGEGMRFIIKYNLDRVYSVPK